eukprot:436057-Hanusia_phi.AAC.1
MQSNEERFTTGSDLQWALHVLAALRRSSCSRAVTVLSATQAYSARLLSGPPCPQLANMAR